MKFTFDDTDTLCVDTIRCLSMDAVEKANSGHPGAPMGLAPVAHVLFNRVMKISPDHPEWVDRDRFILSCGHASALLYSVLHLSGFDISLEDLKNFRQWGSKTAGHPEYDPALGIEMTTGPLGQGCATSVGFALAEAHLGARFNTPEKTIVDHMTWVLCSDGDLMEGVTSEAASIAGHLGLGKLVWIWDDNRITIEGATDITVSDDYPARFAAQGWHVLAVEDANDLAAVTHALEQARSVADKPTLIRVRSHIGYGAPNKQDTSSAHGEPLGHEEIRAAKASYGVPVDDSFAIPESVTKRYSSVGIRGQQLYAAWQQEFARWSKDQPADSKEWDRRLRGDLPANWHEALPVFAASSKGPATRAASGTVINAIAGQLPELIGGSADLAPSTKTTITASGFISRGNYRERNLHFGIREHGMGAMVNGMSLHGGLAVFGATFFVFSDYMRPSIRLAALMKIPVIFVFTHDSIWVGEDGPTHQPVEHIAALRLIPNLVVLRPADANETAAAWKVALERKDGPSAILLTRQGLPILEASVTGALEGVAKGAYIVAEPAKVDIVLLAAGSEVTLIVDAAEKLAGLGIGARAVSMPSWELFDALSAAEQESILGSNIPRVSIEAGVTRGWRDYVGDNGITIGIDRFGASAPGRIVAENLGLTTRKVIEAALKLLRRTV